MGSMSNDAHERAIERLACIIQQLILEVRYAARMPDACDDPARLVERAMTDAQPDNLMYRDMEYSSGLLLDALGLVAVDPALVEAVREAESRDAAFLARGGHRGDVRAENTTAARLALADAVLAQLDNLAKP
jgi:hypothetical protein